MENTNITYETLSEKHLAGLVALCLKVFKSKRTEAYFRLKYLQNPIIADSVSSIACDRGKVVGFVGAIPQKYSNAGREYLVAHSCEYQTHPDYRLLQIHSKLVERTNQLLRDKGVNLLYAYFSDVSQRSVKKLGWNYLRPLNYAVIRTGAIPIQKAQYKLLGKSRWKNFAKTLDQQFSFNEENEFVMEVIDAKLLNYRRFTDNGIFKINGCDFWIKLSEVLHVGKFSTKDFNSFKLGLEELVLKCKQFGIDKIVFQVDPLWEEFQFLEQFGCKLQPGANLATHHFNQEVNTDNFRFTYSSFDNF